MVRYFSLTIFLNQYSNNTGKNYCILHIKYMSLCLIILFVQLYHVLGLLFMMTEFLQEVSSILCTKFCWLYNHTTRRKCSIFNTKPCFNSWFISCIDQRDAQCTMLKNKYQQYGSNLSRDHRGFRPGLFLSYYTHCM